MSISEGMDPGRVREIAQQIRASGDKVSIVRGAGDGQLATLQTAWSGDDLARFDDGWREQSPALERMAESLRHASEDLLRQVDSQEDASDGGTKGAGTGAPTEKKEEPKKAPKKAKGSPASTG